MTLDVRRLVLVRGGNEAGAGFSAMEAVAFAAGEAWSERPRCASPTITEWMIAWNDGLDDSARQELRRYIWRLVGSKGTPAQERARRWMTADWLVRGYASAWLEAAGLLPEAQWLMRLPALRGPRNVAAARTACLAVARTAREERNDAWRRAAAPSTSVFDWSTAGAVWRAVADATWAAAGSAARAVIWSSTDATGPGAADARVWDAVSDAAADAAAAIAWRAVDRVILAAGVALGATGAGAAAPAVDGGVGAAGPAAPDNWEAARVAAGDEVGAVGGAGGTADGVAPDDLWSLVETTAQDVLASTGSALQASAHVLVERMLAVTESHQPTAGLFNSAHPHRHHRLPRRR